jgi:DHA3 family macrolide efflux protein-like MFS transporter
MSQDPAPRQYQLHGMRAFYALWGGQFVSIFATQMTFFAITLWAWDISGAATTLVLVGLASFLPRMLLSPFAGTLVDRWNRKLVMALSDAGAALATGFLLSVFLTNQAQLWHLYVAGFFIGGFGALQYPAVSSVISTMVPKDQFTRANSLRSLIASASGIGAPLLAGGLIALIGINGILLLDLATFFVAIATLLIIHIPQPAATEEGQAGRGSFWQETMNGLRYILARTSMVALFVVFMFSNIAAGFVEPMVNPLVLARSGNDATVLGLVRSAGSAGYLIGGLLMTAWKGPRHRMTGVGLGFIAEGLLGAVVLALGQAVPAWMVGYFLTGLSITIINTLYIAILQAKVAPDLQGRIFGLEYLVTTASFPIGQLMAGFSADRWFEPALQPSGNLTGTFGRLVGTGAGAGIGLVILFGGMLTALVGLSCFLIRPIREIEVLLPDHPANDAPLAPTNAV